MTAAACRFTTAHLYIAVGDTGANATPPVNKFGSCLNKGNGKILRVNLDGNDPDRQPAHGRRDSDRVR